MKWFNPFFVYASMKAYAVEHFWAWHISSVWSWVGAFGASITYPNWARDLLELWDKVNPYLVAAKDAAAEVISALNTA